MSTKTKIERLNARGFTVKGIPFRVLKVSIQCPEMSEPKHFKNVHKAHLAIFGY